MSGEPDFLAVDAAGLFMEYQRKRRFHDVDPFLRECQFVTIKRHPDKLRRVKKRLRHEHEEG